MFSFVGSSTRASSVRIVLVILFIFFLLLWIASIRYRLDDASLICTQNATLGFGATILISLPERTDRRDAVSLIASTSNITITHTISAVRGDSIVEKAKPSGKAFGELDDPHWGSWRSHLDALKYIVDNRIETALIWEDDIDWAPTIKDQLRYLAEAMQSSPLTNNRDRFSSKRPYGTNWDLLHLGVSKVSIPPSPYDRVSIPYQDLSMPPDRYQDVDCHGAQHWYCFSKYLQTLKTPGQSRAVIPSYEPVGLVALAVTFRGAQKLLYLLSWKGLDTGLDWSIRDYIREGELSGWTVLPPLFGSWVTGTAADSDIRNGITSKRPDNLNGKSRGVQGSVRQHLKQLIVNEKTGQISEIEDEESSRSE